MGTTTTGDKARPGAVVNTAVVAVNPHNNSRS